MEQFYFELLSFIHSVKHFLTLCQVLCKALRRTVMKELSVLTLQGSFTMQRKPWGAFLSPGVKCKQSRHKQLYVHSPESHSWKRRSSPPQGNQPETSCLGESIPSATLQADQRVDQFPDNVDSNLFSVAAWI